MKTAAAILVMALGIAGCTKSDNGAGDSAAIADTGAAATAAPATTTADASDPDANVGGTGLPAGMTGRTDRADAPITGAKYVKSGDTWEVTTGPAHIAYDATKTARGNYTASATIEQLETPQHPEAFGLFIGGRDLDQPTQTYTYFLVRGNGEVLVKVREGDKTRDVIKWTANKDVPKADASGKGSYALSAQVTGDAVKFMVNGKQVASVSKAGLPTDGIAGLRINHNLHVKASPVTISGT
ncbi:MAG TPA: hypothetical protein VM939_15530 [Gemmatimonadaceae bacterium]|nr:hypothetical protein [Gemmatimonadaceae bacterium]